MIRILGVFFGGADHQSKMLTRISLEDHGA
jgi:hypothetical protein